MTFKDAREQHLKTLKANCDLLVKNASDEEVSNDGYKGFVEPLDKIKKTISCICSINELEIESKRL